MKTTIPLTNELKILNEEDILNEILYLIYKFNDEPKYSTISELIYVLGKDSLYRLCSVLGGCDIKVPTLLELKLFSGALYVYSEMKNKGVDFDDAFKQLDLDNSLRKAILAICAEIEKIDE